MAVVHAWMRLKQEGVARAKGRLRSDPGQWMQMRMVDLRERRGGAARRVADDVGSRGAAGDGRPTLADPAVLHPQAERGGEPDRVR